MDDQPRRRIFNARFVLSSVLAGLLLSLVVLITANHLAPLPVQRLRPEPSTVALDRHGGLLRAFLAPDDMWRIRTHYEDIPPCLENAVLGYEDQYFRRHFGVNPVSVARAAMVDLLEGRFAQGASTITMQLARLMEPKDRTLAGKIVEVFRAFQLEWRFSKNEILSHYFNLAPYGGNIVGVGAASRIYFNKEPHQLSLGEAALLAAIPNSPNTLRPDRHPRRALRARNKVLRLLAARGRVTREQLEEALSEPVPGRRYAMPFEAPHLTRDLKLQYPGEKRLETTLDPSLQHLAEVMLRRHLKPLRPRGIANGAVVIIENGVRELRALAGSYDFFDFRHQGQVNGATAPRSPGSALKPFVYALGMQHGLVSPRSLLYDIPVNYSGYQPLNYDRRFHGPVSVEEALVRSLNVPAVSLDAALKENGLYYFLKDAGLATLPEIRDHYGLSLVLGGCEVTLLELANLYAGLAEGGRFRPCRWLESQPRFTSEPLLDPGVCYLLTEILTELRRPDFPSTWERFTDIPKVAWKTGTSYGHRDAWSVGYTPRYTIGVWVGNFDGKGAPELVGAEAAAPVLFSLFSALEDPAGTAWFSRPDNVKSRRVCSVSGMPAGPHCPSTEEELHVPGLSPHRVCDIHQVIQVDKETGKRLCPHCRIGRDYEERVIEKWPARMAAWMEKNGYPLDPVPEHFPRCTRIASGDGPVIVSPPDGSELKIRPGAPLRYQKIFLDASVSNLTRTVYWFLDGQLVFSGSPAEKVFILPAPGAHTLLCMDDEGRSTRSRFTVHP